MPSARGRAWRVSFTARHGLTADSSPARRCSIDPRSSRFVLDTVLPVNFWFTLAPSPHAQSGDVLRSVAHNRVLCDVILRQGLIAAQLMLLLGCAGPVAELSTIPAEEAAWQAIAPRLADMPAAEIERCAGPPRGATTAPGGTVLVYRDQDLKNYCQVSLLVRGGR